MMPRILSTLLILISLSVMSCNGKGETTNQAEEPKTEAIASEKGESGKTGTIQLTKEGFLDKVMDYETNQTEWIYKGDKPCLIDFYADWCGPCKIASPVLEELANEYGDKIYIYKVNTEKERELSATFGIRSIPSFLFCPSEGKPTMSNGIAQTPEETKEMFKKMIDEILLEQKSEQQL